MTTSAKNLAQRAGLPGKASEFFSEHPHPHRALHSHSRGAAKKPLVIMKFGGTSVGDASCVERVVAIIRSAAEGSDVVVVVSAMSGVTNQLVAAAGRAEAGDRQQVSAIFEGLRRQHHRAADRLIHSEAERSRIGAKIDALFAEGDRLCQGTALLRELTPRSRDAISSLGERLSILLVAAALAECGVAGVAIEATELVVTDGCHGNADPCMELTRRRCEEGLRPLLQRGVVPVVTGFIGATADGVLTTLGRGGSDYSATILGAALRADEVIIWTDVDGLQTADPRLVPGARTIAEVSYGEAAELAYFGAKVLHPKTLRAITQRGIPLWIRNTFEPQRPGTKITAEGPRSVAVRNPAGVIALSAIGDVALLTLGGAGLAGVQDVLLRTLRAAASVRADVLLISQASSQNGLCLVIPSAVARKTADALRQEFAHDLAPASGEHLAVDENVGIVTVVGQKMKSIPGIAGRSFAALGREQVNIVAISQGSSECSLTFVVAREDMKTALASIHREFELGGISSESKAKADDQKAQHWNRSCSSVPAQSRHFEPEVQPNPDLSGPDLNRPIEDCAEPSLSLDASSFNYRS
ncbi:MAG: aspartate kinase [Candidatus Sulfotelmatobacter sp.]|jgi:bifunctional aspartokinase / homoserine dehydrogenase 1